MIRTTLVLTLACGMGLAHAQEGAPNPAHGPTGGAAATHSVAKYLELERGLQKTIAAHDSAALGTIVDPDFELRTPAAQDTLARGDLLKGAAAKPALVRELAVLETDDLAMVSFLLETQGAKRQTYFVVDVWRQSSGTLQARYIAVPSHLAPRPRKPDGRE